MLRSRILLAYHLDALLDCLRSIDPVIHILDDAPIGSGGMPDDQLLGEFADAESRPDMMARGDFNGFRSRPCQANRRRTSRRPPEESQIEPLLGTVPRPSSKAEAASTGAV